MKNIICSVLLILVFVACRKEETKITLADTSKVIGGIKGSPYEPITIPKEEGSDILKQYNYTISNLSTSDVYAIFVNKQLYHNRNTDGQIKVLDNIHLENKSTIGFDEKKSEVFHREFDEYKTIQLTEKSEEIKNLNIISTNEEIGVERIFNMYRGMSTTHIEETFILVSKGIREGKTYKIWVQKNKWSKNDFKKNYINEEIASYVSNIFFENKEKNIFEILKNIYGEFWFDNVSKYREIIDGKNEVNIALSNLNNNYSGGRILGYFNPSDVYTKEFIPKSNEKVLFFIDAYSLADNDGMKWDKQEYWTDMALSTVAHEFMHIINFYHKNIRYKGQTSTWLSEMMALIAEDLVSTSINTKGPRGVEGFNLTSGLAGIKSGRLNSANLYINTPLNLYYENISYEQLSSFGLFLLRNYTQKENGLKFLRDILWSEKGDFDAIKESLVKNWGQEHTIEEMLMNWGKSIILSNSVYSREEKYKLNSDKGFDVEIDNITYKLGGINRYNYANNPVYLSKDLFDENRNNLKNASIVIYELDKDISGEKSYNISVPNYVDVELVVRDSENKYDYNKFIKKNEIE